MDWDDVVINFEVAKEKREYSSIEEKWNHYLSKMDEGTISYEELVELKELTESLTRLGHKAKSLLNIHLQDPERVDSETIVKELLAEYQKQS
jgi:hypothetical protein